MEFGVTSPRCVGKMNGNDECGGWKADEGQRAYVMKKSKWVVRWLVEGEEHDGERS